MPAATDRIEFVPPEAPGRAGSFALALLVHGMLVVALAWGVNWKSTSTPVTVEAELWASLPQQAAPKLVQAPPPTPVVTPPAPPPPVVKAPDIVVEKVKPKPEPPPKAKPEPKPEPKPQPKPVAKEPPPKPDDKALKRKQELDARQQKIEEEKHLEKLRQENLARIAGLAGATGNDKSPGTALKSAGPSASYGDKIQARVRPKIVYSDEITGNPKAEVEVRTSPDGTIVARRLTKPSGVDSWDDAVLRAIDKTAVLPKDVDGRVPPTLIISFQPRN